MLLFGALVVAVPFGSLACGWSWYQPTPTPTPSQTPDDSFDPTPTPAATNTPQPTPTTADGRTCQTDHPNLDVLQIRGAALGALLAAQDGRFSNGTLVVDVEGFDGHTVNWRSNRDLVSVFLRTNGGGAEYGYESNTRSDSGLSAGGALVDISFCYARLGMPTPEATGTPRPTPPDTATVLDVTSGGGASGTSVLALVLVGLALVGTLIVASRMGLGIGGRRQPRRLAAAWSTSAAPNQAHTSTRRFQVRP